MRPGERRELSFHLLSRPYAELQSSTRFLYANTVAPCTSGTDGNKQDQLNNYNSKLFQTKENAKGTGIGVPWKGKTHILSQRNSPGVPLPFASEFFAQWVLASPQKWEAGSQKECKQEHWHLHPVPLHLEVAANLLDTKYFSWSSWEVHHVTKSSISL